MIDNTGHCSYCGKVTQMTGQCSFGGRSDYLATAPVHDPSAEVLQLRAENKAARDLVLNILGYNGIYVDNTSYFVALQRVLAMRQRITELENEVFEYRQES